MQRAFYYLNSPFWLTKKFQSPFKCTTSIWFYLFMQVHRTIKPPITIYYTDDIMGEVVDYIRISSNRVREVVLQEHHQNAQCLLLLWQIMGNFARLRSTFTQCGHGPLWWWHRCFFYETWQKFTHITYRKKIQGWENRGSSVWPINAIVAKNHQIGFFNRCPFF